MKIFTPCDKIQDIYRTLLKALTHPGKRHIIETSDAPESDHWLLFQVAGCLMDHEVTFALTDHWKEHLQRPITDRTGSRAAHWHQADFILINGGTSGGRAEEVKRGTLAYPDRGATILYCLDENAETEGNVDPVRLSGPGIQSPMGPQIGGLEVDEYRLLRDINSAYPLGVDAFVIEKNNAIMGLPRSTRIEVE